MLLTLAIALAIYFCPPGLFKPGPDADSYEKLEVLNTLHFKNERARYYGDISGPSHMEQFRASQMLKVAKEELEDEGFPVVWDENLLRYVFE